MNLGDTVKSISSKEDLIKFIGELRMDFNNNSSTWENSSLESYLAAMQSWLEDIEGWAENSNLDISRITSWELIGHILFASKMYE